MGSGRFVVALDFRVRRASSCTCVEGHDVGRQERRKEALSEWCRWSVEEYETRGALRINVCIFFLLNGSAFFLGF